MNNSIDFYGSWGHVVKQALAVGMQNLSENRFFLYFAHCELVLRCDEENVSWGADS